MEFQYKQVGNLFFDERTDGRVCDILNMCYASKRRVRLFYGNVDTGRCWMDEFDTIGCIGRSTGEIKIPLLIKSNRSMGGVAVLDHCIVKITIDKETVYQHEKFHMPKVTVDGERVLYDDCTCANFKTNEQANKFAAFMKGERNSK